MAKVFSFPPLAQANARVLVLGSMPGVASLRVQQYYAHPHNIFWPILGEILAFDPRLDYLRRVAALLSSGIAVWDVLQSCERDGSLDSDIQAASVVPNDFATFLSKHTAVQRICFNGSAAEMHFRRRVQPTLADFRRYECQRLPSTSPANASQPRSEKLRLWRDALDPANWTTGDTNSAT